MSHYTKDVSDIDPGGTKRVPWIEIIRHLEHSHTSAEATHSYHAMDDKQIVPACDDEAPTAQGAVRHPPLHIRATLAADERRHTPRIEDGDRGDITSISPSAAQDAPGECPRNSRGIFYAPQVDGGGMTAAHECCMRAMCADSEVRKGPASPIIQGISLSDRENQPSGGYCAKRIRQGTDRTQSAIVGCVARSVS